MRKWDVGSNAWPGQWSSCRDIDQERNLNPVEFKVGSRVKWVEKGRPREGADPAVTQVLERAGGLPRSPSPGPGPADHSTDSASTLLPPHLRPLSPSLSPFLSRPLSFSLYPSTSLPLSSPSSPSSKWRCGAEPDQPSAMLLSVSTHPLPMRRPLPLAARVTPPPIGAS